MRKTPVRTDRPLDAVSLKDELWDTLKQLKNNTLLPGNGDAIAAQGREILRTVRTQMAIFAQAGLPISEEIVTFAQPRRPTRG